ncbi:hypothetical protein Tsubulata_012823 [Turnera subulata]|uniref:Uncharacterized protein n=1 Tax=Turnera subulata TaxID=218843 RepID=A0A9Q0FFI6_9ROSI|nr:hypothetical protein Tsubulata_012823 [Turnera subulata]
MGTKLDYAINLLATSQNSSSISVQYLDEQPYLQARELNRNHQITRSGKISSLMDRTMMPDKNNPDFIRKTMQMHEDIFKHQVRELHRLYSVQKMLMEELKKEIKQTKQYWNPMTNTNCAQIINGPNPTTTHAASRFSLQNFQALAGDDPSPKERSGSCSGETARTTPRGFDLEMPAEEDISTRVSTMDDINQAGPSSFLPHKGNKLMRDESDEDSEVELTLSIGGGSSSTTTGKKKSKNSHSLELDSLPSFKSERAEDCSTPTTPLSSSSATFDQERKRPHWLFQGLSINRT